LVQIHLLWEAFFSSHSVLLAQLHFLCLSCYLLISFFLSAFLSHFSHQAFRGLCSNSLFRFDSFQSSKCPGQRRTQKW
jgi:hypothetical protein